jgi:hypothetical protein
MIAIAESGAIIEFDDNFVGIRLEKAIGRRKKIRLETRIGRVWPSSMWVVLKWLV